MREWLASLLTASLVSVIAELLSPEGKMKRYVCFAVSLLLLAVMIAPIADLDQLEGAMQDLLSDSVTEGEAGDSAALGAAVRAAEQALASAAEDALRLREGAVSLSLEYGGEAERPVLLGVTVRVADALTGERVRAYIERETGVKCEVIVS